MHVESRTLWEMNAYAYLRFAYSVVTLIIGIRVDGIDQMGDVG